MSTRKSLIEIEGFEHDWLACDLDNHVALFSTAGGSYATEAYLEDTDAHELAIKETLGLQATTEAISWPLLDPDLENTWKLAAERGIYAYDGNAGGRMPYELIAVPRNPVRLDELPSSIVALVLKNRLQLRFADHSSLSTEQLKLASGEL